MSSSSAGPHPWTTYDDVVCTLRRRWERGTFLTARFTGHPWEPLPVPLRGPTAAELGAQFGAAQAWTRHWESGLARTLRIEHKPVGGRLVGTNQVPSRVWIDSYEQLWRLLRVGDDVARFAELLAATRARAELLTGWVTAHPLRVLALESDWTAILETVLWIDSHSGPDTYVREIDVPLVDTKFVERHRGVLCDLLDRHLAAFRIDQSVPRSEFAGRYRLRRKPGYVRLRHLASGCAFPGGFTEISVRLDELGRLAPQASTVFVLENEITYLAFPEVDDAIAIFGGGYAVPRLQHLPWLQDRDLVYWGDLDTHGFSILNTLRDSFPHARSMLMDRDTLLAHQTHWVREPSPTNGLLPHLRAHEVELYRGLVEDSYGPAVRLEQERIHYSAITAALAATSNPSSSERVEVRRG
jgi:hypothetical protein